MTAEDSFHRVAILLNGQLSGKEDTFELLNHF